MDLLEKGRQLAQKGDYEEALEALHLAMENDKENADLHFYIGLCYSALQKYPFAKYHYQLVQAYNPDHPKISLVWPGIKDVEAEKPPERHLTRSANAKFRREQSEKKSDSEKKSKDPEYAASTRIESNSRQTQIHTHTGSKHQLTDDKWEQAFPTDLLQTDSAIPLGQKILVLIIGLIIVGVIAFGVLKIFKII